MMPPMCLSLGVADIGFLSDGTTPFETRVLLAKQFFAVMDCAAQMGTRIRIYIRGLSEQPQRVERCKATNTSRRHLKLAVFVAYKQKPKIFVTQSSDVPGVAAAAPSSEEKTAMDAAEHLRILKLFDKEVRETHRTRRGTLNLVHDRASIHTSHVFKDGAEKLHWKPILLPTKGV